MMATERRWKLSESIWLLKKESKVEESQKEPL
jgi:hypothetical protein